MANSAELSFYGGTRHADGSVDIDVELPDLKKLGFSDQAMFVYSEWLLYMRKGPKWAGLSLEKRLDIACRLREWVRQHPWSKRTDTSPIVPRAGFMMVDERNLKPEMGVLAAKRTAEGASSRPWELLKVLVIPTRNLADA